MKNFWKIFGIIALVAIIGFSMLACEEESSDDDDSDVDSETTLTEVTATIKNECSSGGTWTHIKVTDFYDNDKVVYDQDVNVALNASVEVKFKVLSYAADQGGYMADFTFSNASGIINATPISLGGERATTVSVIWGGGWFTDAD
ncbi:MAG: hypothetical protein LBV17_07560 [Treponema sp.]|nr:hypothetical protein [Treponema sp.]